MSNHFMHYDCTVEDGDGNVICYLNARLLDQQGIHKDKAGKVKFERLKELHRSRHYVELTMKNTTAPGILKHLGYVWTMIQYALQQEWGFREDPKFHEFWNLPKCTCPKLDNEDRHPAGKPIFNIDCPIHG